MQSLEMAVPKELGILEFVFRAWHLEGATATYVLLSHAYIQSFFMTSL